MFVAKRLHICVLAAGQGTRMRSDLPKVLQPLSGKTLLEHVVERATELGRQLGKEPLIQVIYGHGGKLVSELAVQLGCIATEQARQLGTGHAVMQALPLIRPEDAVLILYADVPLLGSETLERMVASAARNAVVVLTAELQDPAGYGRILRDVRGNMTGIVEHKDATDDQLSIREINTGIMAVQGESLLRLLARVGNHNSQGEYYLTDLIGLAVAEGLPVGTVVAPDEVEIMGVNDKLQLATAERALQYRQAMQLMRAGVTLRDPARFDLRGTVTAGKDVEIDVNVLLEGQVSLGNRVRIGPNCVIRNAVLDDDVVINANTLVDGAHVGAGAQLGPFARIRPGTELGEGARIGNFVEIKKSVFGRGSKANHLAYVGDAEVGNNVNIGAGVITCNYDGANKHKTLIGDDAFIGSDCQLVAPVEVGAGATLGAGTTLVSQAPAGKLTISRPRQITIENWQRPKKQP